MELSKDEKQRRRRNTITTFVALFGLLLALINLRTNLKRNKEEKETRIERLIGDAKIDFLIYRNQEVNSGPVPERHLEQAGTKVNEVLILDPNNSEAMTLKAIYFFEKGETRESIRLLREAVEIDDSNVEALERLGELLYYQGKTEEAVKYSKDAASLDPNSWRVHSVLGAYYYRKIEYIGYDESIEEALHVAVITLYKATRLNPNDIESHYLLGRALLDKGDPEAAYEYFCKVVLMDMYYQDVKEYLQATLYILRRIKDKNDNDPFRFCFGKPSGPPGLRVVKDIPILKQITNEQGEVKEYWEVKMTGELRPIGE